MAISYVGKSTFASGTAGLTVAAVSGVVANDLILLFVESANQAITTPTGYTIVTGAQVSAGTAAAAGGMRLNVFYRFATGADGTVTVADTGDHTTAIKLVFRGVNLTTPFDATPVTGTKTTASTTATFPGITTATTNAWVVLASALDLDAASTATTGAPTNGNLTGLTERHDQTVTSGFGGGIVLITGTKAVAGATGNTTATVTNTQQVYVTLALRQQPVALAANVSGSATASAVLTNVPADVAFIESLTGVNTFTPVNAADGDLLIAMAFHDGSTTPPTVPAGWTTLSTAIGSACSAVLASRTTVGAGTFTNATSVVCNVYRKVGADPLFIGNVSSATGTTSPASLPALTLTPGGVDQYQIGFAAHTVPGAKFPDINEWRTIAVPANSGVGGGAYGEGVYVITGAANAAASSPDGFTWTARTLPQSANWDTVVYGNGRFLAFSSSNTQAAYSDDGFTWTGMVGVGGPWAGAAYGNSTFVSIPASGQLYGTSAGGTSWTSQSLPVSGSWKSIAFGAGLFVLVQPASVFYTSPDGVNWTSRAITFANWNSVVYGADKFVAVGRTNGLFAYSADGTSWTTVPAPNTADWTRVTYGNGVYVAVAANSSFVAYSYNGIDWFLSDALPASAAWGKIFYGADRFHLLGGANNYQLVSPVELRRRALVSDATDIAVSYDSGGPASQVVI